MTQFLQFTVNGLAIAAIYSLIALGFSLIYKVSRVLNLAQGSFYVVSAFIAFTILSQGVNIYVAFLLTILLVMVLGLLFERLIIRPVAIGADLSVLLLLTLGTAMVLDGLMKIIWGTDPIALPPVAGNHIVEMFGITILAQNILILGSTVIILLALYFFFKYTFLGKSMTAVAENPVAAGIMGINTNNVRSVAFAISAAIGALGGILASPITLVAYDSGTMIGLKGFIAAVVGGVGNVFGGIIGGLTLALAESYSAGYISSLFQDTTSFLILIVVLIVRSLRQKGTFLSTGKSISNAPLSVKIGHKSKWVLLAFLAFLIVFPYLTSNLYILGIATIVFIYILAALGLDLLHGFTGVLSLGQAGFMAIAGYTSAILVRDGGVPSILAIVIALAVSMLVAWLLAISTVRLTGYNIAISTLGFSVIIESIAVGLRDITGGSSGFTGVPPIELFGFSFGDEFSGYYLTLVVAILGFLLAYSMTRSKVGRVMKSINQDPVSAASMGINVPKYKNLVFVIAAGYASVAGILYTNYMDFISPSMVGIDTSILLLVMVTLGGAGSLWGVIPGVIILKLIPELFSSIADYQIIFEGLVLILTLIFFKGGFWSLLTKLWSVINKQFIKKKVGSSTLPDKSQSGMVTKRE